ncbi:MAG: hypothetical protein ACXWUP_13205 [Allosphingosinicella sp.]
MRRALAILILLCALAPGGASAAPASADPLAAISWLVGNWAGVGEGQPGTSTSSRHAERIHDNHFIRVEARSVYPAQQANPSGEVHTSLDLWSFDRRRDRLVMRQFDSLGFVSTYVQDRAASVDSRLVLVSEGLENVPTGWRARYTYEHVGSGEYRELFELDSGRGYELYVFGRFHRQDVAPPSAP